MYKGVTDSKHGSQNPHVLLFTGFQQVSTAALSDRAASFGTTEAMPHQAVQQVAGVHSVAIFCYYHMATIQPRWLIVSLGLRLCYWC